MCTMPVSSIAATARVHQAGSPTVATPRGKQPNKRSAARVDRESGSETGNLEIPHGQVIQISVVSGISEGMEFELLRPLMTIGRLGGEADIQIDDPQISRLHCAVEVRHEIILLHDLRSMNGTFIADCRILSARLEKLSQFRIGSSCLQLDILPDGHFQSKPFENPEREWEFPEWQAPLQEAILEFDCEKLTEKITEVETLLSERLRQLARLTNGSREQDLLTDALSTLRVIKRDRLRSPAGM
jgi:pSer/pThr/pTyr-binding forkhead associated (FHA) protein